MERSTRREGILTGISVLLTVASLLPAHGSSGSFSVIGGDAKNDDTSGWDGPYHYYPGDQSPYFSQRGWSDLLGVPLGWLDILSLEARHSADLLEMRLHLQDVPEPAENLDEVRADPSRFRKLVDEATGVDRYAVHFRNAADRKTYISTIDVVYAGGKAAAWGRGYWGINDRQGSYEQVPPDVSIDSVADTITFRFPISAIGSPQPGTILDRVIAGVWGSVVPSWNPAGTSNWPVNPLQVGPWMYGPFANHDYLPDCRKGEGADACSALQYVLTAG